MAADLSHLLSADKIKHKYGKTVKIFCNLVAAKVAREVKGNGNAYTEMHRSLENNNNTKVLP